MSTQGTDNTPNRIFVDPVQGQQALQAIKERQEHFLSLLSDFGDSLVSLNNASASNAINQAMQVGTTIQTQVGQFVVADIGQYCEQVVLVINSWQNVHATAATPVTYSRPTFNPVFIPQTNSIPTVVSLNLVNTTITGLNDKLNEMLNCFDTINGYVGNSSQWWQGRSGDLSRQTWSNNVYSIRSSLHNDVSNYLNALTKVSQDLAFRDSGGTSNDQDLIKWYPQVLSEVYGELSTQYSRLQHLSWELDAPNGGTGILGQVGVWGQYQAIVQAVEETLSGLNNFLNVQEAYLQRVNLLYQPLVASADISVQTGKSGTNNFVNNEAANSIFSASPPDITQA